MYVVNSVLVLRKGGAIKEFGSAKTIEDHLAEYERSIRFKG
jgi:hypothetical protein